MNPYAQLELKIRQLQLVAGSHEGKIDSLDNALGNVTLAFDALVEVVRRHVAPEISTADFVGEVVAVQMEIAACISAVAALQWLWREVTLEQKQQESRGLALVR